MTTGIGGGPQVMMTLGEFQFSIATAVYQEIARATDYRWPGQDRFGQEQALQFVGPGGDTMNLPGVIYPQWRGGYDQMDYLRSMAADGEPYNMIDGSGVVLGRWVIERIEEKSSNFAAAGAPMKIEFNIDLRRFGDVEPEPLMLPDDDLASNAEADAKARAEGFSGPDGLADKFSGSLASISSGLASAQAQVAAVTGQIGSTVSSIVSPIAKAVDTANGLKNSIVGAKNILSSTTSALRQAKSLTQLVNAGASAAANAGTIGKSLNASVASLQALGTVPGQAIAAVQGAAVQVNRLTSAASKLQIEAMDQIAKL